MTNQTKTYVRKSGIVNVHSGDIFHHFPQVSGIIVETQLCTNFKHIFCRYLQFKLYLDIIVVVEKRLIV